MLPPINALGQRAQHTNSPMNTSAYLSSSSLSNFAAGSSAAHLAGYSPYSQFPMFAMAGNMNDMASLNPSALTSFAMQGLHNPQYYRTDSTGQGHSQNPSNT